MFQKLLVAVGRLAPPMGARLVVILGLLFLVLGAAAAASAATPPPWNARKPYGATTSFGWIGMEPRLVYRGEALDVTVPVLIEHDAVIDNATFFLFSFNLHEGSAAHVRFTRLESDGRDLPVRSDERSSPRQPKLILLGPDVPRGQVINMTASLRSEGQGRYHVGAMVMAFGPSWQTLATSTGERAQLYGFSMLHSTVTPNGFLRAPVQGYGNDPAALLLPLLLSGTVLAIGIFGATVRLVIILRRPAREGSVRTG